jgi:UDP-galactopyranose mutase
VFDEPVLINIGGISADTFGVSAPDVLVVGAGFAGAVMAERIAAVRGLRVLVIDRRDHIAGNAFDARDEHGVLIHRYGPHIFHTNAEKVSDYLSRFTDWRPYEHRVLAEVGGRHVPMPINRTTLNALYGLDLGTEAEVQAFYDTHAEPRERLVNSEDAVVAKVGRDLYETLFRGYTRKQWGLDPSELHAQVCARIPVRTSDDDRYFNDAFQCMPADGYTALFERLLDHPRIEVRTGTEFSDVRDAYDHLVWTGPIDEYYGHRFGALPYRSLRFETETRATPDGSLVQPVAVINHPDEATPYTRVTEYRHLTGQAHGASTLHYEYPSADGDPYYPVPRPENRELYQRYAALAARETCVTFVGRLARYQYLNMDQVVAQALSSFAATFGRELVHA